MNDDKIHLIVNNEIEWRRLILSEVSEIKKVQAAEVGKMTRLETKFSFVGAIFGAISGLLVSLALKLFETK